MVKGGEELFRNVLWYKWMYFTTTYKCLHVCCPYKMFNCGWGVEGGGGGEERGGRVGWGKGKKSFPHNV